MMMHFRKVVGTVKLNYEELTTVLAQIEACLNSRPLAPMTASDGEVFEVLTPGHFLIGKPLCALPHPIITTKNPQVMEVMPVPHPAILGQVVCGILNYFLKILQVALSLM